ncbi:hypothetical protein NPIL_34561 [Nephila pilipes]|uniref:Uncharacterized protein n=1 Tax=Nephila pilipes TaxID=299642 RepID=A0A8X6TCY3_NEPPI|nr:hypothetical protein NPIL_34561 [Nephila pilipes]
MLSTLNLKKATNECNELETGRQCPIERFTIQNRFRSRKPIMSRSKKLPGFQEQLLFYSLRNNDEHSKYSKCKERPHQFPQTRHTCHFETQNNSIKCGSFSHAMFESGPVPRLEVVGGCIPTSMKTFPVGNNVSDDESSKSERMVSEYKVGNGRGQNTTHKHKHRQWTDSHKFRIHPFLRERLISME